MFSISFPVAFAAGVVSFFAPCVVSLLPAYVGYVLGVSLQDLRFGYGKYKTQILISSVFYILGFSIVFVALGTTAAGIGQILRQYADTVRIAGGFLVLILGLNFAGWLNLPFLARERKLDLPRWASKLGYSRSFLIGIVFGAAWTPCVGVILGTILSLAAVSQTATTGAALLFVYSLGISVPFLFVALTLSQAPKYLTFVAKNIKTISRAAGILLAILGVLLITDAYRFVNAWLFQMAFSLGYQIR